MKKSLSVGLVITLMLFGVAFATDAEAQFWKGKGHGRGMGPGEGPFPWCPPGLNLSPEQIERLQTLRSKFFNETASLRAELYKKQLELETLFTDPSPDAQKAGKLQADISDIEGKIDQKRIQAQLDARKILTPEQIAQLPPGCTLGFGPPGCRGFGPRGGCGFGPGYGRDMW
ncbi:MAG: Spy/CpxP family protein refolding chaperone [Desulfobacterota bacterium]|nr:Spy/CpxP family protein refolding chaperone [Thermodesulfobacteriota bacterium]